MAQTQPFMGSNEHSNKVTSIKASVKKQAKEAGWDNNLVRTCMAESSRNVKGAPLGDATNLEIGQKKFQSTHVSRQASKQAIPTT